MNTRTKYGIYATSALIVLAVGGPPIILIAILLLALMTWKGNKQ